MKGKNNSMPIRDVRISYDDQWINKHLNAIKTAYHGAPFYFFISEFIIKEFGKRHKFLYDLNIASLMWIMDFLELDISICETDHYYLDYEKAIDLRNKNTSQMPNQIYPYTQIFEEQLGFTADLSIIDLLMCMGKEARSFFS